MKNYNETQQVQINYYRDKIFRALATGEKEYAKELEEKLFSLKQKFKKENTQ